MDKKPFSLLTIFIILIVLLIIGTGIYLYLRPNKCESYGKEYMEHYKYENGIKTFSCCKNDEECIVVSEERKWKRKYYFLY